MTEPVSPTAYTGEHAETYDEKRLGLPGGQRLHQIEREKVVYALRGVDKQAQLLEIGCGTGRLLLEVCDLGYRVDGVDASPDMLALLKKKCENRYPQLRLKLAEAASLPFEDNTYDLTYSIRLLNQTESPEYALRAVTEMFRVTKPGGLILAEFINARRPHLWHKTTRLTPSQVIETGEKAGGMLLRCYGAFFLGMTAYLTAPPFLLGAVGLIDYPLTRLFPRLCARVYVLMRKGELA